MRAKARSASVPDLLDLDRVVHEPARLVLLTILSGADTVEFKFLEEATKLTKGNLSSHVSKLEAVGYLEVIKVFRGKIPVTSFRITRLGRTALEKYRSRLFSALPPETAPRTVWEGLQRNGRGDR